VVINVEKLSKVGVTVRIFENNGKGVNTEVKHLHNAFIEVFFEKGGKLAEGIEEGVKMMVESKVYATALIENIAMRIHQIQIMEAIARTEDE
jgi:hypothetical protein